ncbi:hypothetical protein Gogos_002281 [Gossypium gossypioides]|uniref:Uncharacterized protein n=1 Tax=Gossypium gossypioides TaxID=34282 RepID=A0A7J9CQY2_GOSGO|nr:hypothetical protein [Gossypium gossypioides]
MENNFQTIEASTSDVENKQFAPTFNSRLIGGLLMPDKSRNLVEQHRETHRYTDLALGYPTSTRLRNRKGECVSIEFWPITTSSMSKCHWLFLQRSRCSKPIKSCDSLSVCNVFRRHPKSLMTYTRSTCGEDFRKIDQHSTKSISRCGSIGTISFQRVNHFLHRSWRHLWITWIASDITASRIYCQLQKGVGNVAVGGQNEGVSILGREMETKRD